MIDGHDTVPIEEVMKRLGIGRSTVYAGMDSGEIPCVKVGDRKIVVRPAFELMMSLGQKGMARAIELPAVDVESLVVRIRRELLEIEHRRIEALLREPLERRTGG